MKRRRDWRPAYTPSPVSMIETAPEPDEPARGLSQASREGRVTISVYTDRETKIQMKLLGVRVGRSQEALVNEAVDMLLNKYGRVRLTMPRND